MAILEWGFDFARNEPKFKTSAQEALRTGTFFIPQTMETGRSAAIGVPLLNRRITKVSLGKTKIASLPGFPCVLWDPTGLANGIVEKRPECGTRKVAFPRRNALQ